MNQKNNKASKYFRIILAVQFIILFNSCKKFIEIQSAPGLVNSSEVFKDDRTALSAATQVYVDFRVSTRRFTDAGMSLYAGLSADEIVNTFSNETWDPFFNNNIPPGDGSIKSNFWAPAYRNLYTINSILEGLSSRSSVSTNLKAQLSGEMKMLRAWYYFNLVNLFGDVPLIITTDYRINAVMPRTKTEEVYKQIVSDLSDAQVLLTNDYPSAGKARPNKWAATALLARVYLYLSDWNNAEAQATSVINSGQYNLVVDLNSVFLVNSPETLLEIAPAYEVGNSSQALQFIPYASDAIPTFTVTSWLLNSFESGDLRKGSWLAKNTIDGVDYYYPFKYKETSFDQPVKEYNTVLRLDEQYLIRSEAKAQQNKLAEAADDLNVIRSRAGLPNTAVTSQADILPAILHERQVELFTEWGHRWFDLKRFRKADEILSSEKGATWQSTDALYPIPYDQLLYNQALKQNPGY